MKKIIALLMIIVLLAGCSSYKKDVYKDESLSYENKADSGYGYYDDIDDTIPEESAEEESQDSSIIEPEKVIVIIDMRFQTTDFDNSLKAIEKATKDVKGFIESSNIEFGDSYYGGYKNAYYSIRVPKNDVEKFKTSLGTEAGTIVSETTNKRDVTKSYKDTETRLKVMEEKEKRLRELLANAKNIENIIEIENSLSETIAEKEVLKSNLMNIDDQVDYSTINIEIREVKVIDKVETSQTKYIDRLKNAVRGSLNGFVIGLGDIIITLIYMLPYLILIILIFFIIRFLFRKIKPKFKRFRSKKIKDNNDENNENR